MTLRVGIISANWGAFAHLPAWRAIPGVEVTAICTSRRETAEAAAARHGIARAFWDAEAMAADPDIDIIDCGTRPSIREPIVLACLRHGKHVYNAIPHAAGLAGARAIDEAWRASGSVAVADAFSGWVPAHALAKRMIAEGRIGRPFGGTCIFNMSLFNRLDPHFPYNWFAQAGHGVSAMRNLGSHALHLLVGLFGPVAELVAHEGRLLPEWRSPDGETRIVAETDDFASILLRFESGLVMQCQISWNAPLGRGWLLDVFGSEGRIVTKAPSFPTALDTTLEVGALGGALEPVTIPDDMLRAPSLAIDAHHPVAPSFPMALSMQAMAERIRGNGGDASPDFGQCWQVERIQEAIRISLDERRWVRIDEIA